MTDQPGADAADASAQEPATDRPVLRVVRGDASAEEVVALVTVLAAAGGDAAPEAPTAPSAWVDRSRGVRRPLPHGPGAWRASSFPS